MKTKPPFRKSGAGFWLLCVLCVLSLAAGCAGNKPTETRPEPVFSPVYGPMPITHPAAESKTVSSTNSVLAQPLSRREGRAFEEGRQQAKALYQLKKKPSGYDKDLIDSVQENWYELLDSLPHPESPKGRVTIEFRLLSGGSISNIKVAGTTVNTEMTALCKQAILNAAPFSPSPPSMRSQFSKGYREIQFTFYFD